MPDPGPGAGGRRGRAGCRGGGRRGGSRDQRARGARRVDRARVRRPVRRRPGCRAVGRGGRGRVPRPGLRGEGDGRADRGMPGGAGPRSPDLPGRRGRPDPVRRGRTVTSPPPQGYLGTAGRITSGPAPELVEAGYALETGDAPVLHRGLTLADLAHLVELTDCGVLRRDEAAPLCAALLDLLDAPAAEFPYDPVYGDAYNSRERELERALGPAAGRLHLGRTRREAGRIAFRIALRDSLLGLHADVAAFAAAVADQAARHAATLWADTTYLQPAQPSTFGHYLGGFAEQSIRHLDRIETAYGRADASPAGAGGAGGTRLPMDRDRLARRLGFGSVGPHTRDAMWSADALVDAVSAAAQTVATISQLASDLEIFASPAFGYLTLDASLCRASVLMPQKRNPYALPVLRGGAGTLIGRLTGLLATGLTPSARTDNWLYAYGEVAGAVDLAGRLVRLDYRTAYRVVGRAVAATLASGGTELTEPVVRAAAAEITGAGLPITADLLASVTDPASVVTAH